jgi:hypothetical protein
MRWSACWERQQVACSMPGAKNLSHGWSRLHLAKEKQEGLGNMRTIVKAAIFRLIQIAWSPIGFVGYVLLVITMIIFSRTSGVSSTTLASLYTRRMQHKLGTRLDEPCERLMMVLPNVFYLALRLVTGGTLLAHRLTGYVPRIYRYPFEGEPQMAQEPAARTTFFDAALTRHLSDIDQLVLLGAGWDTRSYRVPKAIHCFEVDTPKTQETKRQMLKKAGLDTTRITFVPADFLTEDWLEKLVKAGFGRSPAPPVAVSSHSTTSMPTSSKHEGGPPYATYEPCSMPLASHSGLASKVRRLREST